MTISDTHRSPKQFLDAAIETALEAGKILRGEYALPPDIRYKGDVDLVTQADRRSEDAIVARLSNIFRTIPSRQKKVPGTNAIPNFAGMSIRSTAPPILRISIRASRSLLRSRKTTPFSLASSTIRFMTSSLPLRVAMAPR